MYFFQGDSYFATVSHMEDNGFFWRDGNIVYQPMPESSIKLSKKRIQGYNCQLMADPKVIAKVFLDYDYATCTVLDNEPSPDMWGELARKFGLDEVFGVDL